MHFCLNFTASVCSLSLFKQCLCPRSSRVSSRGTTRAMGTVPCVPAQGTDETSLHPMSQSLISVYSTKNPSNKSGLNHLSRTFSLGACSSVLWTTFSPNCGAWHSPPALVPGGSGMEKDTSLNKAEQAGAQLMHKLPAAVWLPEFPCVLLRHTQHKPAEIDSSRNTEVAPHVFCRTV